MVLRCKMKLQLVTILLISILTVVICSGNKHRDTNAVGIRKSGPVASINETDSIRRESRQYRADSKFEYSGSDTTQRVNRYQISFLNSFGSKLNSKSNDSTPVIRQKENENESENENDYNFLESTSDSRINEGNSRENNSSVVEENNSEEKHIEGDVRQDLRLAGSENGKTKKGTSGKVEDEEEKTLAQQVADGKYGLIQNELFANGSSRPGILSYLSNSEVPKDTKDNLGGLEKDEIWLAEDHILVLRGGRYGEAAVNETTPSIWAPIDDYKAPNRQVKIPKNPKIPPPFPVQLTENGPLQFIKGKAEPSTYHQLVPPFGNFPFQGNYTLPFLYGNPPPSVEGSKNLSAVMPIPPVPLPPFLTQFPPGATFLTPPGNGTDFDEDDPSIYYPPKYDFYYPQANNSPVPPGPLVPGIILPPPPDFFAPLENEPVTDKQNEKNETDISFNTIVRPPFAGPKYLPADNKESVKLNVLDNRKSKRPHSYDGNTKEIQNLVPKTPTSDERKKLVYVYPENTKSKIRDELSSKKSNLKVPVEENSPVYNRPVLKHPSFYHPLPTTSPKPNHITVPNTLSKDIYIVTNPEGQDKNKVNEVHKKPKKNKPTISFVNINPELHPLRSLIRPNISVSYTGKYGHLPPSNTDSASNFHRKKPTQVSTGGHYITVKPPDLSQNSITPTADVNVTPIPIVKKIRIRPVVPENGNPSLSTHSPSKATFYFYEEPTKTETPQEIIRIIETTESVTPSKPDPNNDIGPIAQYYSIPISTSKIPIRQFLEETFQTNAITPQSPRPDHPGSTDRGVQPTDKTKVQTIQYASPNPLVNYQQVTELPPLVLPNHKIKALEIHNSGSTGLQKVNLDKPNIRVAPKPYYSPEIFSSPKPPTIVHFSNAYPTVAPTLPPPSPTPDVNDGPFIPSNYYATAKPEHVHFTSQEQTLVDDITKNYFTIFGQKINSVPTTPLTPIKIERPKPSVSVSNKGKNVQIIPQVQLPSVREPSREKTRNKTTTGSGSHRPKSHFEQYLKEITGEDQSDYIVTGAGAKIPKGKGFFSLGPIPGLFPSPIYTPQSIPLRTLRVEPEVRPYPGVVNLRQPEYPPNYSTTLRPVLDVQVNPQFVRHLTSPPRTFSTIQPSVQHQKLPLAHNLGQYLQEITSFSPAAVNPVASKSRPSRLIVSPPEFTAKTAELQSPGSPAKETGKRPMSLESDIVVNFKSPLPQLNHESETINIKGGRESAYAPGGGANIKIVDSPDLSKAKNTYQQTEQFPQKTNNFDSTKNFFQNLPNSGYFSPSHQPAIGNSFVSYNLPGNGGHFYFLTPQILSKSSNEQRITNRGVRLNNKSQISSRIQNNSNQNVNNYRNNYSTDIGHNLTKGYSNHDYIRRRRKKS